MIGQKELRESIPGSFCFGGTMEYIEMDESESLGSTVSEETLRLVAAILGPEVKDMLLYPVVEDVRLHRQFVRDAI